MAKTMKELSEEYYPIKEEDSWKIIQEQSLKQVAFETGVLAVFEAIDFAIRKCDVDGSPYVAVLDKIKELKGEK